MKQPTTIKLRVFMSLVALFLLQIVANAQDQVVIDKQEVSSWIERNWPLLAGALGLLILLIIMGRRTKRRSKSTTVISDDLGNVKKVTTTEVKS